MVSSAIRNKWARVNFLRLPNTGSCNLWSLKKFTSAYLFQIAGEKSFDYLLIIYMKKFRDGWAEGTQSGMNCAIQGVRLIWKQKIWLAICEFFFRDFPVNQVNFKFLHSTSSFFIQFQLSAFNFNFLHSISTFCTQFQLFALNFNFLHCLGLIDMLSANQQWWNFHGET